MMVRFNPPTTTTAYSAGTIFKALTSTTDNKRKVRQEFPLNEDHLKIDLASNSFQKALKKVFRNRIEFTRSYDGLDIISEYPYKFDSGYQITFLAGNCYSTLDQNNPESLRPSIVFVIVKQVGIIILQKFLF